MSNENFQIFLNSWYHPSKTLFVLKVCCLRFDWKFVYIAGISRYIKLSYGKIYIEFEAAGNIQFQTHEVKYRYPLTHFSELNKDEEKIFDKSVSLK